MQYADQNDEKPTKKAKNPNALTLTQAECIVKDFEKAIGETGWETLAEQSWERFQNGGKAHARRLKKKNFPLWWATTKVRQPLLFGKVPTIVSQPVVADRSGFLGAAAGVVEKLSEVLLNQFPFYSVAASARDDLILTNVGTARVMIELETAYEPAKEFLTVQTVEVMSPEGQPVPQEVLVDSQGQQVDPGLVLYDFQGQPYVELPEQQEEIKKKKVVLKPCCYKDFIWDHEAKDYEEWDYQGFKSCLTRSQIKARFGSDALSKLPEQSKDKKEINSRSKYDIIELWWKPNKTRYIWARNGGEFLKETEDPLGLQGFFPSPYPLFDNLTTESSIPAIEYGAVKGILEHIDDIYSRKSQAVRISRPRGLYDSEIEGLSTALQSTSLDSKDWIGVPNLAAKAQSGSIFTQYIDTAPILQAIQILSQEFQAEFASYDQITGFSDIVRGVTNPFETATASERKSQFAMHRLIPTQKDMQRWCRDALRLLIDAALQIYEPNEIFEMISGGLNDFQRQNFERILQKLKSDCWRSISLEIETDSTILIDEDTDKSQALDFAQAVSGMIEQIGAAGQSMPEVLPLMMKLVDHTISKFRGGKEFQKDIQQTMVGIVQSAEQKAAQAQQPPPPSLTEQFEMQIAQTEIQMKQMGQQIQAQKDQAELALKGRELEVKQMEAQIQAQAGYAEQLLEQQKFQFMQVLEQYRMQFENARLQLEDFKARALVAEKQMEEYRLARDTELNQVKMMIEANKPAPVQNAQTPMVINLPEIPVNVNVDGRAPGRRSGQIIYDELGNAQFIVNE